jgi:RimJ/RimL family protein N-acetyltransferase
MYLLISNSGKKIKIREPVNSDIDPLLQYINALGKEDIYLNANPNDPYSRGQEEVYLKGVINRVNNLQEVHFLAWDNSTLIGSASITKGTLRSKHVGNFGISLAGTHRLDGIGYQLSHIIIAEASQRLSLRLITLSLFADNIHALHLYQKLGFKQYGQLPGAYYYQGSYKEAIYMYLKLES